MVSSPCWDYMHGTVEQYTKQGKHLGEFNAETGKRLSDADPKRSTQK
ncbi:colicin E3/pyocin S6 family cytotoxin [Pseudomonas frederiksbergensis]